MKIVITGTTGRLGAALARVYQERGWEILRLDRKTVDLEHRESLIRWLGDHDFDVLINPAAVTSLEKCEDEPVLAHQVNAEAPQCMAAACRAKQAAMIHVSTDYVFDGETPEPCTESDPAHPVNVYGRTKLAGERLVLETYPKAWVARVSWLFGPDYPSFVETILGRHARGEPLAAIADKQSVPSYVDDIAEAFVRLLDLRESGGVVHVCNGGSASWHTYGREVMRLSGGDPGMVAPLRLEEMTSFRARRPVHTAMTNDKLAQLTGLRMRPWQEALADYLSSRNAIANGSGGGVS